MAPDMAPDMAPSAALITRTQTAEPTGNALGIHIPRDCERSFGEAEAWRI